MASTIILSIVILLLACKVYSLEVKLNRLKEKTDVISKLACGTQDEIEKILMMMIEKGQNK